jgi:hypothetical protein
MSHKRICEGVLTTEDNKALVVVCSNVILIINISFDYLSANKLYNTYHNSEVP